MTGGDISATEDKNISGGVKRRTSSKKLKANEKKKQRTTTYTFLDDDDDDEEEEEDLEMSHQVSGNWESFALNSLPPATYTNLKNAHLLTKSPDHSKAPGGSPTAISLSGTTGPTGVVGLLQKPPSMSLDLGAPPVPTSNSNPYSDSSLSTTTSYKTKNDKYKSFFANVESVEADAKRVKEFVVLKIFPIVKFLASASMLNTYVRNLVEVGMNVPVEARTDAWWQRYRKLVRSAIGEKRSNINCDMKRRFLKGMTRCK